METINEILEWVNLIAIAAITIYCIYGVVS
jgi:hypothetical protein